ncbi:MAG: HAMP domain-containing protein [Rubrivivax sp.]|nr:HAMP domain-containing protein [Rubrivivax sp.]
MNAVRNASVGLKVALAPSVAILCMIAVGALGMWNALKLSDSLVQLEQKSLASMTAVTELQRRLDGAYAMTNQSLAWTGAGFPEKRVDALDKELMTELTSLRKFVKDHVDQAAGDPGKQELLTNIAKAYAEFERAARDAMDMKGSGLPTAAAFVQVIGDTNDRMKKQTKAVVDYVRASVAAQTQVAVQDARVRSLGMAVAAVVAVLLAGVVGWWCSRLIVGPLREAQRVAGSVARGDLTDAAVHTSTDETGQVLAALGNVSHSLSGIVCGIRDAARQIDTASSEIATGNADLSARTENIASVLEMAASSVEELAATVNSGADSAREASSRAETAALLARDGGKMVDEVVRSMEAINDRAKTIGEIIGTIDGIAFQTNILALNAAVEAARAGEQGRGFSVVASEVRQLARRSADASREIRALISSSVEQIDAGTTKARATGATMQQVVGAFEDVAQRVGEVSRASAEQATGIAQVNRTVAEIDRSTQQNAAMVEQSAAATSSLRQQAEQLVQSIERFRTA